ncbi:hypothetical protein EDD18DRAFT_1147582 [Armillaria luteobubalina]|uniref:Uncharacterized protein n=1 Tax=Armillaria luteobubalina TaxID=153913 RepID=A0AA39P7N7_9AGAR|nr:hypothetical protein EDD18DRAFT_1208706 [Armillaria luteobubalina]KAK0501177.1 hypothetical protein EDD18DRAFT_1147582 [Armillaria luteobubalina]
MSKDIGTRAALIHDYYHQQPPRDASCRKVCGGGSSLEDLYQRRQFNEHTMAKRCAPITVSDLSLQDCGLVYQQALEWAQSLSEIWKRPSSTDVVHFFPLTDELTIRVWDSNISRRPDSSMRVFGLDFVDVHRKPQYVGRRVVVIAGMRMSATSEMNGDVLEPIDDASESKGTVPERYGVVAGCAHSFFSDGKLVATYTFAQNLLDS